MADLATDVLVSLRRSVQRRLTLGTGAVPRDPIHRLPGWVQRHVVVSSTPRETWLWCEPGSERGDSFPSQIVLNVKGGAYLVDVFDAVDGGHVSSESAKGGPLVVGLTHTGHDVFVRVRKSPAKR